ncbi:hypothetical protein E4U10_002921 [Claviceps purpurea]|nr:hypothetical protein E4U12_001910 [Claviceps purpurea]KAG6194442.1 hypothetical protein E4U10_002921 [Claviceps purpurea]
MKFFSPFFIFVFGALVTPIIGHAVPNVEGGVDVVERDFAGAPAHLFARKKCSGTCNENGCHCTKPVRVCGCSNVGHACECA